MVRAAVLSIVLALALGPNATLFCSAWCHQEEATPSACQHQYATASPRVTGEDGCRTISAVAIVVRAEANRGPLPLGAQYAVVLPPFLVAPQPADASRTSDSSIPLAGGNLPLLIALRI